MALLDLMGLGADKQAVILDVGTIFTKVGLAGEQSPRHVIRTELNRIEERKLVCTPILRNNSIDDCELRVLFKEFFHEIYFKYLLVNPKERRVVVCDAMLKPIRIRDAMAKVLFEYFEVVSIVFVPSHLLALFACGLHTGLVIDAGFSETTVVPVYEHNPILNGLDYIDLAAQVVHDEIRERIKTNGKMKVKNEEKLASGYLDDVTMRVLEDIKIRCCFIGRRNCELNAVPVEYPLGGDKILTVSGEIRAHAMDILFSGDEEGKSIATLILDSILKTPVDCRKPLAENIILAGGSVMAPGFESRLMAELKFLLTTEQYKQKLFIKKIAFRKPPVPANYCAWQGAALLGALEILPELSVSRERYHAEPNIPDWSSILSMEKEDVSKSLLDDKYKWKRLRKSLPMSTPSSSTSLASSTSSTTTTTPVSSVSQSATNVSERIRQQLGLTK